MNAIANPTLPSESEILDRLEKRDDTYNGYGSLLDAFLALIPEPAKVPENDSRIERLYRSVRRAMRAPTRPAFLDSQEHWALL